MHDADDDQRPESSASRSPSLADRQTNPAVEPVVVQDIPRRRRFMRAGTALLMAGGALVGSRQVLAADCDRAPAPGPNDKNPKQAVSGSDSDTGANADPVGCGRRRNDAPKISQAEPPEETPGVARVARISDTSA